MKDLKIFDADIWVLITDLNYQYGGFNEFTIGDLEFIKQSLNIKELWI